MRQISAQVISNSQVVAYPGVNYFLMRVRAPEIVPHCTPGQFLMLKCGSDTLLRRPISVHRVIESTYLELLYAVPCKMVDGARVAGLRRETEPQTATGTGIRWLSKLKEGSQLDLIGPLGNGFTIEPPANRLLLVAGGIGLAPLRFLAEHAISKGKDVILMIGARTGSGIFPPDMLPSKARLVVATEDGAIGRKATIVEMIPEYIDAADQVFACGPEGMYEALSHQMENWPAQKPVQVSLEVRMGCGTGVCYSCSIRTRQGIKRVCKEGPVFNIKDIIWQEVRI